MGVETDAMAKRCLRVAGQYSRARERDGASHLVRGWREGTRARPHARGEDVCIPTRSGGSLPPGSNEVERGPNDGLKEMVKAATVRESNAT